MNGQSEYQRYWTQLEISDWLLPENLVVRHCQIVHCCMSDHFKRCCRASCQVLSNVDSHCKIFRCWATDVKHTLNICTHKNLSEEYSLSTSVQKDSLQANLIHLSVFPGFYPELCKPRVCSPFVHFLCHHWLEKEVQGRIPRLYLRIFIGPGHHMTTKSQYCSGNIAPRKILHDSGYLARIKKQISTKSN